MRFRNPLPTRASSVLSPLATYVVAVSTIVCIEHRCRHRRVVVVIDVCVTKAALSRVVRLLSLVCVRNGVVEETVFNRRVDAINFFLPITFPTSRSFSQLRTHLSHRYPLI